MLSFMLVECPIETGYVSATARLAKRNLAGGRSECEVIVEFLLIRSRVGPDGSELLGKITPELFDFEWTYNNYYVKKL